MSEVDLIVDLNCTVDLVMEADEDEDIDFTDCTSDIVVYSGEYELFHLTVGDGIEILDASSLRMFVEPAEWPVDAFAGTFYWSWVVTFDDGPTVKMMQGKWIVRPTP